MTKFVIESHFRLQEWVAEEKGYFRAEGLDYEFRELIRSTEGQHHNKVNEGAFQSIEKGRKADVSCACHWTVNVAASNGHAKLYADVYSVSPETPLDEVVATMGSKKYGSAVVVQNGKVVGIFTTVDLCRAFAELLHTRLAN